MSLLGRIIDVLQAKTHQLLDRVEDPNTMLDLSYEKMISGLQETKRHLADVVAEQKSLERQIGTAQQAAVSAESDARLALQSGREDLAKAALGNKQSALQKLQMLMQAHDAILPQATKLIAYEQRLEERIEQFRTQKEVMKSGYAAAQAQVKVSESLTGIGQNLGNLGDTMRRAQDKVLGMQSKAEAMDGLIESGVLRDPLDTRSSVDKELAALRSSGGVDADLQRLKAEVAAGLIEAKPASKD